MDAVESPHPNPDFRDAAVGSCRPQPYRSSVPIARRRHITLIRSPDSMHRGCYVPRVRKRPWLGSLSPCRPSPSLGVGPSQLGAIFFWLARLPRGFPDSPAGGSRPTELGHREITDSPVEEAGFEPSVPRRTAIDFRHNPPASTSGTESSNPAS